MFAVGFYCDLNKQLGLNFEIKFLRRILMKFNFIILYLFEIICLRELTWEDNFDVNILSNQKNT